MRNSKPTHHKQRNVSNEVSDIFPISQKNKSTGELLNPEYDKSLQKVYESLISYMYSNFRRL